MDLLTEGIQQGLVEPTQLTRRLVVDGQSQICQVYKIRLDCLYYNAQNDRIATWISLYKSQNQGQLPQKDDREAYNNIIEEFIVKSNEEAIRKTSNNIRLVGQQVAGVVIANGLVIDGNRRFTCLRRLAKEDERFNWFEAVILPMELASDAKRIKTLELNIQHGEETRVDYDPVERLVGVYNDIIRDGLFTAEEYAQETNMPLSEINKMIKEAKYMIEFLGFMNATDQFFLARELMIGGPLGEIPAILNRCPNEESEDAIKDAVYANILVEPQGDITRHVRKFKSILRSPKAQEFIDEQKELAIEVKQKLAKESVVDSEVIRTKIRADQELVDRFALSVQKAELEARGAQILATPLDNIEKASELLDGVDFAIMDHLDNDSIKKALGCLNEIQEKVDSIRQYAQKKFTVEVSVKPNANDKVTSKDDIGLLL